MLRPYPTLGFLTLVCAGCAALQSSAEPDAVATVRASVFTASRQERAALDAADGRVIVAWESRRQEHGSTGVYARAFDEAGRPWTHEMRVNATLAGMQGRPAVAALPGGGAWIAWESYGQDGSGAAVVARRFDAELMPQSEEVLLAVAARGDQAEPALAAGADGGVLAVWCEAQGADGARVRGRWIGADGALGAEFEVAGVAGADDRLPAVTACGEGFVIAWARRDRAADRSIVLAQRRDARGAPQGEAFALDTRADADAIEPSVDGAADGSFLAAWLRGTARGWEVRARRCGAEGAHGDAWTVAGDEQGWNSGVAALLAADGSGAVAWNAERGPSRTEMLRVARYGADGALLSLRDADGALPGAATQAMTAAGNARRAALTASGALALAWSGDAGLGDADAAHLTLLAPRARGDAPDLGVAQAAPAVDDAAQRAAIPPIYDPNWVPQPPYAPRIPPGADFGFEAVPGTGWTPPDPEVAIGPQHVVVMVNGQIACFDKNGLNLWRDEIEDNFGFWGAQGATGFVFDPECTWDPHSQRFLAMACERSSNSRSVFLLAISKDDTPTTAADWWKYRLDVTTISDNDIDSPNMAVGPESILLTADFFGPDKYLLYAIQKSSVLNGGLPVTANELIVGATLQSMGIPVVYDADNTLYVLQSTEQSSNNTVIFHAIRNPFTAWSRVTHTLAVPTYTYPNQPPQKGSSSRPFLFEPRFWSVAQRNGSIWAVHHVDSSRARVRWYQFDLNGWPTSGAPSIAQSGELDYGDQIHTFFPSIHVDAQDNAAITFARSSPTEYISMGRALRAAGDPPNVFRPMQVVQTSDNAHNSGRWGDYSGTQADPSAGPGVFWGHHEFTSGSTNSWRSWVARYELDATAFRLTVPPVLDAPGPVTLTVTGATPGGAVQLLYTEAGPGLTFLGAYGAYSSLTTPILGPTRTANPNGVVNFNKSLPGAFAGRTFWLQAIENDRATNWEKRTVQ
jgi:hypothetical protein